MTALLAKAKQYCQDQGVRFTPLREAVYVLLLAHDKPVGAYELLDQLKSDNSAAKPATIYRSLEFLLENSLIHRIESNNTYVACHHFGCAHPVQFLICDQCGSVDEIQSEGLRDALSAQATHLGFQINKQTIEAHGICRQCQ